MLQTSSEAAGDTPSSAMSRSVNRSPDAVILSTIPASTHLCGRLADTAALSPCAEDVSEHGCSSFVCERVCAENGTSSVLPSPFLAILLLDTGLSLSLVVLLLYLFNSNRQT